MEVQRTVRLQNETGLHLRPATLLVELASSFTSDISIAREDGDEAVDAKSILSLLTLGITKDTALTLRAEGEDADKAIEALAALISGKFDS